MAAVSEVLSQRYQIRTMMSMYSRENLARCVAMIDGRGQVFHLTEAFMNWASFLAVNGRIRAGAIP